MHPGIYLGPTRNLQGTYMVLGFKSGIVKKYRTITTYTVPVPYHIIGLGNMWRYGYQKTEKQDKLEFLNYEKLKYHWHDYGLDDT